MRKILILATNSKHTAPLRPVGFYDALGAGRSVEFAFKLGCRAIAMAGKTESTTPMLIKGPAVAAAASALSEVNQPQLPDRQTTSQWTDCCLGS